MVVNSQKNLKFYMDDPQVDEYKILLKMKLAVVKRDNKEIDTSKLIFSVSQLQTYESCPKKYLFQYIYKLPTKPKHYFDYGTSIHTVLELLIDEFEKDEISQSELFSKSIKLLHDNWISKGYENKEQEKEYFDKSLRVLSDYISSEISLRNESERKIKDKEKDFIFNFEGKRIRGIIDRVDELNSGDFEIIDYKTSNYMETESKLKNNLQLFVYALATKERLGKFPKRLGLWYLIHNKLVSLDFEELNFEILKERMLKLMDDIEAKNFDPTPSDFGCRFCDFNIVCKNAKVNR